MPSQKITDNEPEFNQNDVYQDGEIRVRIKRRRYHPTKLGSACINAMTGQRYHIKQGSFEELRLFKMIDATAYYDKDGFLLENKQTNHDPNILFYDSPEEYMIHMKTELSQEQVNNWHINKNRMFPESNDYQFSKEAYDAIRIERCAHRNSPPTREVSSKDEW